MRQPLVAGNWKMNGSRVSAAALVDGLKAGMNDISSVGVAICVPYVFLADVQTLIEGTDIILGAEDCATETSGAYTGEIAAAMLPDFGCTHVIVGHSERRALYGETDEIVATKYAKVQEAGMTPIFCVGETLAEREQGITEEVVGRQMDAVINASGVGSLANAVIAYEPVWAIGTGMTASPEQAQQVHAFIRGKIAALDSDIAAGVKILYGGSMKPGNAVELIGQTDVDGGLIGGASLNADDFLAICKAGM
jgi:triosephosphate isomerase